MKPENGHDRVGGAGGQVVAVRHVRQFMRQYRLEFRWLQFRR